jgi:hypothetical protein
MRTRRAAAASGVRPSRRARRDAGGIYEHDRVAVPKVVR